MSQDTVKTSGVGTFSIIVAVYCAILMAVQIYVSKDALKVILSISSVSFALMIISAICISLTYYAPRLGSDVSCFCYPLWSVALFAYVSALYLIKSMYVIRIYVISFANNSNLGSSVLKQALIAISVSLSLTCITCLVMMIVMTDGTCHADTAAYGCITDFRMIDVYVSIGMIVVDSILFFAFCYKWYALMAFFRNLAQKNGSGDDDGVSAAIKHQFIIQLILTIIAMVSCVVDGLVHIAIHEIDGVSYHSTMIVFLFDGMLIQTCNFFMTKASQELVGKALESVLLCCCSWGIQKGLTMQNGVNSKSNNNMSTTSDVSKTKSNTTTITSESTAPTKNEN